MDGEEHAVEASKLPPGAHIQLEEPGPVQREYQLDGSDTTARDDRNRDQLRAEMNTPWYRWMSWLRDEASYSRWQDVRLIDLADGHVVASGREAVEASPLPSAFRLQADLRRPEAPARIWLASPGGSKLAGLSIEGDTHRAVWRKDEGDSGSTTWLFPHDPWPFAAGLLELIGRTAVAAMVLLGIMGASRGASSIL